MNADAHLRLDEAMAASGGLAVGVGWATDIGGRGANDDFAAWHLGDDPVERAHFGLIAAVADGVGGARGGRVAAELTVRGFIDGQLGQSELLDIRHTSARSLDALNRWVHQLGRSDAKLAGMATTFTGVVLRGRQLHAVHVGDSRLYRLRDGRLERLTVDHRPAGNAAVNLLTRAVGAEPDLRIDYLADSACIHDRYLLCTDGVHGVLSDRALHDLLQRGGCPTETAESIIAAVPRRGDNATALVIDVADLPPPNRSDLAAASARLPIIPAPKAGTVVDDFELETLVADGRYSRIFRAIDRSDPTARQVVIKFPKPGAAAAATLRQAIVTERWIAARVRSPWLGEIVELAPGRASALYAVAPWYGTETLEARLARRPLMSLTAGITIATRLAKALVALHRANVVHRDVKPDNVMLTADGDLRLIDLGVARLPGIEDLPPQDRPGTPSYMAPELFDGASGDEQSDVFALGITIHRLFSGGAYPYGEIEAFSRPRFGRPVPLSRHRPDLPAWLDHVLDRAIAADRSQRFSDMVEFLMAIEDGETAGIRPTFAKRSLYERDPVRFLQCLSLLLAILLLISLLARA